MPDRFFDFLDPGSLSYRFLAQANIPSKPSISSRRSFLPGMYRFSLYCPVIFPCCWYGEGGISKRNRRCFKLNYQSGPRIVWCRGHVHDAYLGRDVDIWCILYNPTATSFLFDKSNERFYRPAPWGRPFYLVLGVRTDRSTHLSRWRVKKAFNK